MREQLQTAFQDSGVPEAMLMDHGTPWWSAESPHGLTRLSVWLMKQGIALHWGRIRHPQTQGKVERFHRELQGAIARRHAAVGPSVQAWLDDFRWEHNHLRPHEALEMKTPASRWRPSERPYDSQPPAWEYPQDAWTLKADCEGTIDIKDRRWRGVTPRTDGIEGRRDHFCAGRVRRPCHFN